MVTIVRDRRDGELYVIPDGHWCEYWQRDAKRWAHIESYLLHSGDYIIGIDGDDSRHVMDVVCGPLDACLRERCIR
jgi:hypothetical protein